MAQDVAQLGQHAVLEPTQQRGPFAVGQAIGVIRHRRLHLRPIGNGCTNIGESGAQCGFQSATDLRIGTTSLDIDHRFPLFTRCPTLWNLCQHTIRRAAHRQDRVDQPINRQPLRSQGRGDRIDQKGHVIIDHANPHEALGSRARDRFNRDRRLTAIALAGRAAQEGRSRPKTLRRKGGIPWQ